MAFDDSDKERIRYHMGYLEVSAAPSIQFGIPRPIQTQFLVEDAMNLVLPAAEERVRRIVNIMDGIECKLEQAQDYLVVDRVEDISIRSDNADALEREYYRWACRLADVLGAPLYPGSERFASARRTAGGASVIPVRS